MWLSKWSRGLIPHLSYTKTCITEQVFPSLSQTKPLSSVGYVVSNRYLECSLSGVCLSSWFEEVTSSISGNLQITRSNFGTTHFVTGTARVRDIPNISPHRYTRTTRSENEGLLSLSWFTVLDRLPVFGKKCLIGLYILKLLVLSAFWKITV